MYVTGLKFKYENIKSASLYFNPNDYMFSVTWKQLIIM